MVRQALLANNRGDIDGFLEHLSEDVEWHSLGLFLHPAQVWHGREGVRTGLLQAQRHRGGPEHVTLRELEASGDEVLALGVVSVPTARRPVMLPVAWVFEVRDGLVRSVETFRSERTASALWRRS